MTENLENYDIVVGKQNDVVRAVAWRREYPKLPRELLERKLDTTGADEKEARARIGLLVERVEAAAMKLLQETLPERHDAFLADQGIAFKGRGMRLKSSRRTAHCIGSHHAVDSNTMPECRGCDAIICLQCAGCGCGSGAWVHPYNYSPEKLALLAAAFLAK